METLTTRGVMLRVAAALVPATLAAAWYFGPGVLANVGIAVVAGLLMEAVVSAFLTPDPAPPDLVTSVRTLVLRGGKVLLYA